MKIVRHALFLALTAVTVAACDGDGVVVGGNQAPAINPDATGNLVQTAVDAGTFNTLAAALSATGLDAVLTDETRIFTVFAPNDAAFAELGQETIDALLADPDTLTDILLYHVLADQNVDSATAISLAGGSVDAANTDPLQISLSDSKLFINAAEVVVADVAATNGTIHVINKVLLPPTDTSEQGSDDGSDSDGSGDGATGGGSTDDGTGGGTAGEAGKNLIEVALEAGSFNTLAAALEATDLVAVLADENAEFTVFAPTDEAFNKLGQSTIDALLADPDTLRDILLYHVVADQVVDSTTAISLAGSSVTMANDDTVAVSLSEGQLLLNESVVTATDIAASNGVIHVLDSVLIPPADVPPVENLHNIYDTAIAAGNFNTLVAALQATGLDSALADGSETYTVFAPTDEAFAVLGQHAIDDLLADPDTLSNILLYHVIGGAAVDAATAVGLAGTHVMMANGDNVSLSLKHGNLFINDAQVIVTDVNASNGIIHVIDAVLAPH